MSQPTLDELFERRLTYPDFEFKERMDRLIGLDEYKVRLTKMLGLLINRKHLQDWATKHHPHADRLISLVTSRPPLVILAGDVGSGKTELAETIGDAVARHRQPVLRQPPQAGKNLHWAGVEAGGGKSAGHGQGVIP